MIIQPLKLDEEEDLFSKEQDLEDEEITSEESEKSDTEDSDKAHAGFIAAISQISSKKRTAAARSVRVVTGEAPKLDVDTLIDSLDVKEITESQEFIPSLPPPLDKPALKRLHRAIGYEKVAAEANRWEGLVKERRNDEHLQFPIDQSCITIRSLEKNSTPVMRTPLQKKIYGLLMGGQMLEAPKMTHEEIMQKKAMSLKEIEEKSKEKIQFRIMRLRMEQKAARVNKSKSRKYHRILRKERLKRERKALEEIEHMEPEKAVEALERLEKARIEERITLRHRHSKWVQLQAVRAGKDKHAKQLLDSNVELHKELTQKLKSVMKRNATVVDSDDEGEWKVKKQEEEKQEAIDLSGFDPTNPWVAHMRSQLLEDEKKGKEDLGFMKMKRFWEEYNRRKLEDAKAEAVAEQKLKERLSTRADCGSHSEEVLKDCASEGTECCSGSHEERVIAVQPTEKNFQRSHPESSDKTKHSYKKQKVREAETCEGVKPEPEGRGSFSSTPDLTASRRSEKNVCFYVMKAKGPNEKEVEMAGGEEMTFRKSDKNRHLHRTGYFEEVRGKTPQVRLRGMLSSSQSGQVMPGKKQTWRKVVFAELEDMGGKKRKTFADRSKGWDVTPASSTAHENVASPKRRRQSHHVVRFRELDCKDSLVCSDATGSPHEAKVLASTPDVEQLFGVATYELGDIVREKIAYMRKQLDEEEELVEAEKREKEQHLLRKAVGARGSGVGCSQSPNGGESFGTQPEFEFRLDENKQQQHLEERTELSPQDQHELAKLKEAEVILLEDKSKLPVCGTARDASVQSSEGAKLELDPKKFLQVESVRVINTRLPDSVTDENALNDDDEENDKEKDSGKEEPEKKLEDIIREAFADDYLLDEFKSEKVEAIEKGKIKFEDPTLPGWGSWAGAGIKMKDNKELQEDVRKKNDEIIARRKDFARGNVIYNESSDVHQKLRKLLVSQLPPHFTSIADYEASLRAPIGKQFVPELAHAKLVAPRVKVKMGSVIGPLNEDMLVSHHEKTMKETEKAIERRVFGQYRKFKDTRVNNDKR